MTQPTNLFSTYDAASSVPGGSIREDLSSIIYNVAPTETPLFSSIEKVKAKNRKHEWLTDTIDTASSTNYHAEGADFSAGAITAATRLSNICQISKKEFVTSGTAEAVDSVADNTKVAYQYVLKGKALKTDIETQLFANNAAVDSGESTARELGGIPAWLTSNVSRGSGGSSGSVGTTPATDGTQRALTESLLLPVCQSMYENSGVSDNLTLYTGAFNKKVISTFSGSGSRTFDAMAKKIVNNVMVYETPFEQLMKVQLNRFMRSREIIAVAPEYLAVATLRPMQRVTYAKDGDNQKHGIVIEYTLEVRNEKALGIVADLSAS